jgi:hypothetical protein
MYKELFVMDPELTHILSMVYEDILQVNKWVVLYFQQRRKTSTFTTYLPRPDRA